MKFLIFLLVIMFVVVTLGLVDLEISFTDGAKITYKSWLHIFD
jgi:hypothetical protein